MRAYEEAQKALTNYTRAMKEFGRVYNNVLEGLVQKYPDLKINRGWHGTEMLQLNSDRSKSALLAANFFGDEVFASLALLLCLEVSDTYDFQVFAIPIASKTTREEVDPSLRRAVLKFLETKQIDILVLFSQAHPYLDGFYIKIPSTDSRLDQSRQIIKEVVDYGHEVGAFSAKLDKPTYAIVRASEDELISLAAKKGVEAYRFMISQDIWAGYRAALSLLKR